MAASSIPDDPRSRGGESGSDYDDDDINASQSLDDSVRRSGHRTRYRVSVDLRHINELKASHSSLYLRYSYPLFDPEPFITKPNFQVRPTDLELLLVR
jgi:hypothetical protein